MKTKVHTAFLSSTTIIAQIKFAARHSAPFYILDLPLVQHHHGIISDYL